MSRSAIAAKPLNQQDLNILQNSVSGTMSHLKSDPDVMSENGFFNCLNERPVV